MINTRVTRSRWTRLVLNLIEITGVFFFWNVSTSFLRALKVHKFGFEFFLYLVFEVPRKLCFQYVFFIISPRGCLVVMQTLTPVFTTDFFQIIFLWVLIYLNPKSKRFLNYSNLRVKDKTMTCNYEYVVSYRYVWSKKLLSLILFFLLFLVIMQQDGYNISNIFISMKLY